MKPAAKKTRRIILLKLLMKNQQTVIKKIHCTDDSNEDLNTDTAKNKIEPTKRLSRNRNDKPKDRPATNIESEMSDFTITVQKEKK